VVGIDAAPSFAERLYELGFVPGAEVELVAKIAFGGPLAVSVRGSRFALRRQDAQCVLVRSVA